MQTAADMKDSLSMGIETLSEADSILMVIFIWENGLKDSKLEMVYFIIIREIYIKEDSIMIGGKDLEKNFTQVEPNLREYLVMT